MVLCSGWIQNPDRRRGFNPGSVSDVSLPGSNGIVVYQDHYGGHCRKKNSHSYNDAVEIQIPKS
jgi:hypothetical protein